MPLPPLPHKSSVGHTTMGRAAALRLLLILPRRSGRHVTGRGGWSDGGGGQDNETASGWRSTAASSIHRAHSPSTSSTRRRPGRPAAPAGVQ